MPSGIAILDATVLKYLEDAEHRNLILRSCRAVDFAIWPTALNFVEVCKTKNDLVRRRGLATLRALTERTGLLPLPHQLLRQAGVVIAQGGGDFRGRLVVPAECLDVEGKPHPRFLAEIETYTNEYEHSCTIYLEKIRPEFQRGLKLRGFNRGVPVEEWLETEWLGSEAMYMFATRMWSSLELGPVPPRERLRASATWRLFVEAHGVALFERLYPVKEPKRVGFTDLSQLVYLAGESRRVFVTDDTSLQRAARSVLQGRYPQTLVESWHEFRAHHV